MDYKISIIKVLITAFTFIVFLKINNKANLSKTITKYLKLNTKLRVFTLCAVVYALLTLTTTLIQYFLNTPNLIIEIADMIILTFTIILFIDINKDVPINDKSWLG